MVLLLLDWNSVLVVVGVNTSLGGREGQKLNPG